jgi:AcrR family transcriptional regulator
MTVKEKKRGRPSEHQSKLNPESIIESAKGLMRQGKKLPSLRGIAKAMEVDPMAIYHYFPNKNALLEALSISLVEEIYTPNGESPWHEELETLCKSYLQLLAESPGLLATMLSMSSNEGPASIFTQRFESALKPLNLDKETKKDVLNLIVDYIHGFALAMNCNPQPEKITIDLINGPLAFVIKALDK